MPTSFLTLPCELRIKIYELCLSSTMFVDTSPWTRQCQRLTIGLLCTNMTIHSEAMSVLYGQNRFDFAEQQIYQDATWFFGKIGTFNAAMIRHARVWFPQFHYRESNGVTLDQHSLTSINTIKNNCPNLKTILVSLYSIAIREPVNPKLAVGALEQVDFLFRMSPSLQEIIFEADKNHPSACMRSKMSFGWTILPVSGFVRVCCDV